MKQVLSAVFVFVGLLTSCAPLPVLWGEYSTPTPGIVVPISVKVKPPFAPFTFTASPFPTSTPPPTLVIPTNSTVPSLTPFPSESPTFLPSLTSTIEAAQIEATTTATLEFPAVLYYAQSGETLSALAIRFSVDPSEIHSDATLPEKGLVAPGTLLVIPDRAAGPMTPETRLIPDSELVFSPSASDFDIAEYIKTADGYLSTYREYLGSTGWTTGAEGIKRLAYENSINPRLLLALLDYESRWVHGQPVDQVHTDYPMGYMDANHKGMFRQLVWAVNRLSVGYYGWRAGNLSEVDFPDGTRLRLNPRLNAATVAIQYLFAGMHNQSQWAQMIDPGTGFLAMYAQMFGDPWTRSDAVGPILPAGLAQPQMVLPFELNTEWNFTGGPHGAWEQDGSMAAIDFAPSTDHGGCDPTPTWITAAASGLIVRSDRGVVVQDLDGDGSEQTGWNLVYLHVSSKDRVAAGIYLNQDERIGHASCEGGQATGTHLHFIRKYNGEWIAADGQLPFVLGGWTIHQGSIPYEGTMTRGDKVVIADPVGQLKSVIIRTSDDQ